jgi:hypothetical protein
MRPGIAAICGEIVRVRHAAARRRLVLEDLIGNAVALAIRDRFLDRVEAELDLLAHIARARPAHQRLDLARLFGLEVEHPFLGLCSAGLHRSLGRLVNARRHGQPFNSRSNGAGLVGAAGFEPAMTWSTQNIIR